ncbi:uncharacterized protein HMPREF1541_00025, partial [Cyphellophora europaea CBS 101466]
EAKIYRQLKAIQGIYILVYLRLFKVPRLFHYLSTVLIIYMLVLSFSSNSLNLFTLLRQPVTMTNSQQQQALARLEAIHSVGVLHSDVVMRNILWDVWSNKMLWHDFDRAVIVQRSPLT